MRGLYLVALLISICGIVLIDRHFKLAYFKNPKVTIKILLITLPIFLVWDIAGTLLDIFFIGENDLLLGIKIGQVPLEEIFFLILLNYNSLVVYLFIKQKLAAK